MAISDGNGWVHCRCGARHWGKYGAAGLLLRLDVEDEPPSVLLQHRAPWSHEGGTWGLPGGARDSHEDVVTAALRETWEEAGVDAADAQFQGVHRTVHPDWSYTTVIMKTDRPHPVTIQEESVEVSWIPETQVATLPLHPGFAASWPQLAGPQTSLFVDIANVMGSRPDGWWRDRAGAAQRLVDQLSALPGTVTTPDSRLLTLIHAVVEGQASQSASTDPAVLVTEAPTADDFIAMSVAAGDWVITADRQLRARCEQRGAHVIGPRWLLDLIGPDRTGA
jgi:8-oxo-dGTP diphosphatase